MLNVHPGKDTHLKMVLAFEANIYKLELGEFERVEIAAFEALSQRKHYLNLSGIQTLSDEEAAVFSRHPGILDLRIKIRGRGARESLDAEAVRERLHPPEIFRRGSARSP